MNRRRRKKAVNEQQHWSVNLEVVHPNAAGIDIGNESHYVAVPPDRDGEPVRQFACFTEDLQRMAAWLKSCGIDTVAMQSTGVYWLPVYEILTEEGLRVFLVNARPTKNLPGRKTDVQECQWLLQLHTFGLLNNSFRPPEEICVLRAYWRQRAEHVASASACIQRMQKVLTEMNVQLANVISDISGLTGLAILQAILAGERDRYKLADLADPRIQASREEIARSLEGNWRKELLFILGQELNLYQIYQQQIAECDTALAAHFQTLEDKVGPGSQPPPAKANKRAGSNAPTSFDLRGELYRISGTDLTQIDGINIMNAQTIIAEVGVDMSRFPSEAHFASFLGLCPDNQITGARGCAGARGTSRTVRPPPYAWPPPVCGAVRLTWEPSFAACEHVWVHPKPSPPWPTCSPGSSTACCGTANNTSTRGLSSTKKNIGRTKSAAFRKRPRTSVSLLLSLPPHPPHKRSF
jgi:transposase